MISCNPPNVGPDHTRRLIIRPIALGLRDARAPLPCLAAPENLTPSPGPSPRADRERRGGPAGEVCLTATQDSWLTTFLRDAYALAWERRSAPTLSGASW